MTKPYEHLSRVYDAGWGDFSKQYIDLISQLLQVTCPLNKNTHPLIGEQELRNMKSTARGPIVDKKALVKALQEGWIQKA